MKFDFHWLTSLLWRCSKSRQQTKDEEGLPILQARKIAFDTGELKCHTDTGSYQASSYQPAIPIMVLVKEITTNT